MFNWIWKDSMGLKYINIPKWDQMGVDVLFTTRKAGFSQGEFSSLNMALHVGDEKEKVIRNRGKVLNAINLNLDYMVCSEQVHATNIVIVDKENLGQGAYEFATAIKETDAMVTNIPYICLTTFYADCFPIFIFDPVRRAVGLAHSGWKGTMGEIGCKTIELMQNEFACDINNIEVFIGPGIGKCCFVIGNDLAELVKSNFRDMDNILFCQEKGFLWDLPNTIRQMLIKHGVRKENILISNLCTSCNTEDFFSYRKEAGLTGRMAAMINLRY